MGLYIKIPDVTFTNYIGIAEIEDGPIIPDVPDVPDEPDVPSHTHSVTHVAAKAATTTAAGNIEYWYCAGCNTYWSDASLTNEITQAETIIPQLEEPEITPNIDPADNIKGLYYLGGNREDSLVNHVEGGNNAEIPSSASVDFSNANFARFTGTMLASRISTKVFASQPEKGLTVVAMFSVPTGIRSIVSAIQSSKGFCFANTGVSAYIGGSLQNVGYNNRLNSNSFSIFAFSVSADGLRVVKSTGTSVTELFRDSRVVDAWSATGGITIGGGQQNLSYGDPADIALVSIHEGDMTDDQLKQIFAFVRNYGEGKGLTID